MVPAVFSERAPLMRRAARQLMQAVWASAEGGGPLPRDIITRRALENACAVVSATGGSTNAALHLPAIAHEAGIRFHLDDVAEIFARTPDRKSTRLNSSHSQISYAVFCLKKKKKQTNTMKSRLPPSNTVSISDNSIPPEH